VHNQKSQSALWAEGTSKYSQTSLLVGPLQRTHLYQTAHHTKENLSSNTLSQFPQGCPTRSCSIYCHIAYHINLEKGLRKPLSKAQAPGFEVRKKGPELSANFFPFLFSIFIFTTIIFLSLFLLSSFSFLFCAIIHCYLSPSSILSIHQSA
jgi:hypothetical protein